MRLEEFKFNVTEYTSSLLNIYALVNEDEYNSGKIVSEVVSLQKKASTALISVNHIIDRFAEREVKFGSNSQLVDKFTEALGILDAWGCAIIPLAVSEMNKVLLHVCNLARSYPDYEVEHLPMLSAKTNHTVDPIFKGRSIDIEDNYCFVLMPFSRGCTRSSSLREMRPSMIHAVIPQ